MKNNWSYITYVAAWISVGAAVCFGIWYIHHPIWLLGFLFAPDLKFRREEQSDDKQRVL